MVEGKVDTATIVECFEQFSQQLDQRTYVFLDNAPVHRSQEFIGHIAPWVKRGLIIKYLPAYAPEFNLIEILWRFMKYSVVFQICTSTVIYAMLTLSFERRL
jgi:transposase